VGEALANFEKSR